MAKYTIKELKEEHKRILKALDKLGKETELTDDLSQLLSRINGFSDENSDYIDNHLEKEAFFYRVLNKRLGGKAGLRDLTDSREVIMGKLSELKKINKVTELSHLKKLVTEFIKTVRDRISLEEGTLFKIAGYALDEGKFE
jgi:hemerythrin-like domain-containing protein